MIHDELTKVFLYIIFKVIKGFTLLISNDVIKLLKLNGSSNFILPNRAK